MFGVDSDRSGAHSGTDDGHRLPAVLHTAPAAVLIIDPRHRQVVYANPAAIELTGERVRLPVDIDAWSHAAGLTDLGGRRMSETDSPLSLVAAGVPVAGEPVAVHDAARRGSSATPNQREASEGRLLRVTGFGLSDNTRWASKSVHWWRSCSSRAPTRASADASRCCATARSSTPRCPSRSPTRAARTTRWSG
jgi:PAS domain-containing protein